MINHLKKMTQVAGKFAFLKPDEEVLIWYGIAVSCDLHGSQASICELYELVTSNYYTLSVILNFYLYTVQVGHG